MEPGVMIIDRATHFVTYMPMANGGADRLNAFLADPRIVVLRKNYRREWDHWEVEYLILGED